MMTAMTVRLEFFGIPRQRAGRESYDIAAQTLGQALQGALGELPGLAEIVTPEGGLQAGYLANRNGREFITDPATRLSEGDAILVLASDVGG